MLLDHSWHYAWLVNKNKKLRNPAHLNESHLLLDYLPTYLATDLAPYRCGLKRC